MSMMWSEAATSSNSASQQVPMTGLQAKRKRDETTEDLLPSAKLGPAGRRWVREIPRVPDPWPLDEDSPPESDTDDEDDDGLLPIEPRAAKTPYRYPYPPEQLKTYFNEPPCTTDVAPPSYYRGVEPYCPPPRSYSSSSSRPQQQYWQQQPHHAHHHHQQQQQQQYCYNSESNQQQTTNQTIRCAENGKSYLELGSTPAISVKCNRISNYRQQRLTVLNISMCKLSRFRQFPDPSLHRSVLICNTLRRIEREMEHDTQFFCTNNETSSSSSSNNTSSNNYPTHPSYPATPPPPEVPHYEHSLRDLASPAPRATPFPSPTHPSNDETCTINWGSVLSLSSQSDLDPLNNNGTGSNGSLLDDLDNDLLPWRISNSANDDVLKTVPILTNNERTGGGGEELDSLMHVLVNT